MRHLFVAAIMGFALNSSPLSAQNWSFTYQSGEGNQQTVIQNGRNIAITTQNGSMNVAMSSQMGRRNIVVTHQSGDGHVAGTTQSGEALVTSTVQVTLRAGRADASAGSTTAYINSQMQISSSLEITSETLDEPDDPAEDPANGSGPAASGDD